MMPKPWADVSERIAKIGPGLRKIIANMGWLMVDRVVRLGTGLFVGVWVARYLGPSQFGLLNFATAYIALYGTVTGLGLDGIVVREVLHHPEETHELLGSAFALRWGGCLLALGVSVATLRFIQPNDREALVLVSILSLSMVSQVFDTIDLYFQSQVQSKLTVWAKNGAYLVFAAIRVAFIYAKAPLPAFAWALTGEALLGSAGLLFAYRVNGGRIFSWRGTLNKSIYLLQQSWPVIFSGMAIMVYMKVDTVMLKMMQGDYAVGLYSAAIKVSEVWYFIPMAIASSVSPAIIRVKDNPELFYDRLRKVFSLMTMLACTIGSVVALGSNTIIRVLYSHTYEGAAPVLAVHVWASVFVFLGVASSIFLLAKNLLKISLYRTVAGAIINVLMNLYLIPRYSAMGAAFATVVSYAVSGVFANAFNPETRVIFYMQMRSFIPYKFWRSAE